MLTQIISRRLDAAAENFIQLASKVVPIDALSAWQVSEPAWFGVVPDRRQQASGMARLLDDRYFIVFLGNMRQIPQKSTNGRLVEHDSWIRCGSLEHCRQVKAAAARPRE